MKYPVIQNSSAKTTALNESFLLHGFTPSALSIPMFIAALEIRILQSLKGCIQFVLHRVSINVRPVSDRPSPRSGVRRRILDLRSSRRTLCSPIPCISIAFLLFSSPLYVGSSRVTREEKKVPIINSRSEHTHQQLGSIRHRTRTQTEKTEPERKRETR